MLKPSLLRSSSQALCFHRDAEPGKACLCLSFAYLSFHLFFPSTALLIEEPAVQNLHVSPSGGRSLQRTSGAEGLGGPLPWAVPKTFMAPKGRAVLQNQEQQASEGRALQQDRIHCDSLCAMISCLDFFVNYLKCRNCKQKPGWFCCVHRLD